jgi:cyclic pyranopterin phosphate synthase
MVDVGAKPDTDRLAVAEAIVLMSDETAHRLFAGELPKGDALASVRLAGIMGAKRTAELILLCHPIPITALTVDIERVDHGVAIRASVSTTGKTGVEMEAMTAVSVASLALYDMVKGVERGVTIERVALVHKSGGRSGTWDR